MPARNIPLVTNKIYHILNRGTGAIPIFKKKFDYLKFLKSLFYYQNTNPPNQRQKIIQEMQQKQDFLVKIIAFCLMPNHFHLLLKQQKNNGIVRFISLIQNSYSRYFNLKYQRKGGVFEGRFKAIRIETEAQLLHLSRYIHLNPHSSYLTKTLDQLFLYPYSSLPEYLGKSDKSLSQKEIILAHFPSKISYRKFIEDQADYQRSLEEIKHQLLES